MKFTEDWLLKIEITIKKTEGEFFEGDFRD